MRQPPSVTRSSQSSARKNQEQPGCPPLPLLMGGNNKTTSKCWSWFQKSPSLMQLPELMRAVTCDKNSGWAEKVWIRLWTRLIFPANVAAPSYPWLVNFFRSRRFCYKKDCKACVIVSGTVERTWSSVKKCSSGFSLTNHLPQMIALSEYWCPGTYLQRWKSWFSLSDYTSFLSIQISIALINTLALDLDVYWALYGPSLRCFSSDSNWALELN